MYSRLLTSLLTIVIVATIGCASSDIPERWPEKRDLGSKIQSYKPPTEPDNGGDNTAPSPLLEPRGTINLRQALSIALMSNPTLRAYGWNVRAKEARALQAGLLPNPEIMVEVENFEGAGSFKKFNRAETTVSLGQLIELGGKRAKRKKTAILGRDVAGWDYEVVRIDILTEVTQAFVGLLLAQERVKLAKEIVGLARKAHDVVSIRVLSGKAPPVDETKSKVALSVSRIDLGKATRFLVVARSRLVALWGGKAATFDIAEGQFHVVRPAPAPGEIGRMLKNNPQLTRWSVEIEKYKAKMALEKSGAIPDVTISGGMRNLQETDENAYVMGVSLPIPVFNRNQGGYREARFNLARAREEFKAARLQIETEAVRITQTLSSAYAEIMSLKEDVLPGAQHSFNISQEGYRQGKFNFLEVLDAQRVLFETRGQYIDALAVYHKSAADWERIAGMSLDKFQNSGGGK
ncbi:Heavy metal RND efflux outer membrane protein, CzcC family [hydrothermal vent metagenome]|uniref:Heavy metal RND efflux outer membrane protein, CzcC family n=1 Tax=hydrothermal vent metagenome TaxID=652676 RepID=A0A3B1BEU8_9ZZZZ